MRGYLLVVLAAACWATGGLTAKWLFTAPSAANASWPVPPLGIAVDPQALSGGRALSAFLLLLAYLALVDRPSLKVQRRDLLFLGVFGVFGLAAVHFTYFMTISLTNVATAILLEYLAPVIVLLVGVLFMGHRFTWALPAGVALSVAGCALVVGAIGGDGLVVSPQGIAWGLASAGFFAFYSLMGGVAVTRFSPYTTLVYGLGFAAVFWLLVLGPARVLALFTDPGTAARGAEHGRLEHDRSLRSVPGRAALDSADERDGDFDDRACDRGSGRVLPVRRVALGASTARRGAGDPCDRWSCSFPSATRFRCSRSRTDARPTAPEWYIFCMGRRLCGAPSVVGEGRWTYSNVRS